MMAEPQLCCAPRYPPTPVLGQVVRRVRTIAPLSVPLTPPQKPQFLLRATGSCPPCFDHRHALFIQSVLATQKRSLSPAKIIVNPFFLASSVHIIYKIQLLHLCRPLHRKFICFVCVYIEKIIKTIDNFKQSSKS